MGATSGVYVWNALGMYPAIPGVGGVVLGTPMFPRVLLQLGGGRTLEIVSQGDGFYVHAVTLNGTAYGSAWLPVDKLTVQHNRLEFTLSAHPDRTWGADPSSYPPSFDEPSR